MKNLEMSSSKLSPAIPKWLVWSFALLSFGGFLDAAYLTFKHYTGGTILCSIFSGCDIVTTSEYATILGVSVALLGAIYYLAVFILTIVHIDTGNEQVFYFAASITLLGFLASLWFVFLQIFIIKALCLYCILSAITSTTLFILGIYALRRKIRVMTE
ncbi:MAG: vitamin K epoxide reductase family protein [bacterium]|nr:vitamin K epoxide reductase family protein [bacterium]